MLEAIIVALIPATAAVICQVIMSRKSAKERDTAEAVKEQKLNDELQAIKLRLDEHNGYAKKFADLSDVIQKMSLAITALQKDVEYLRKDR